MGRDEAHRHTTKLIEPYPNTYTYTKNLAENLIHQQLGSLPIAIVRPTIIVPALKDPIPGWVDSLIGPSGLALSGGLGIMRFMRAGTTYLFFFCLMISISNILLLMPPTDPSYIVDFIPVRPNLLYLCSSLSLSFHTSMLLLSI